MLLATELAFQDRPSVTFGNWGTVGAPSPMRHLSSDGSPVSLSVFEPPSGPAEYVYREFVGKDLANKAFCAEALTGLLSDDVFSRRLVQPDANYGGVRGSENRDPFLHGCSFRWL